MSEVFNKGGLAAFWRGASATVVRAVTLGAVKMASYDASKLAAEDRLGLKKGTMPNTLSACLVSGADQTNANWRLATDAEAMDTAADGIWIPPP